MNRFKLQGTEEQQANFFAIALAFSNSMPMYETIVISSWPLAGNKHFGMCIQLNEKLKNVHNAVNAIAIGCGVTLVPLSDYDEQVAARVINLTNQLAKCREFIEEVVKLLDRGMFSGPAIDMSKARSLLND